MNIKEESEKQIYRNSALHNTEKFIEDTQKEIEEFCSKTTKKLMALKEVLTKEDFVKVNLSEVWSEFINEFPEYENEKPSSFGSAMGFKAWAWNKMYDVKFDWDNL